MRENAWPNRWINPPTWCYIIYKMGKKQRSGNNKKKIDAESSASISIRCWIHLLWLFCLLCKHSNSEWRENKKDILLVCACFVLHEFFVAANLRYCVYFMTAECMFVTRKIRIQYTALAADAWIRSKMNIFQYILHAVDFWNN